MSCKSLLKEILHTLHKIQNESERFCSGKISKVHISTKVHYLRNLTTLKEKWMKRKGEGGGKPKRESLCQKNHRCC